jgi:6-phosphogluconolactonase
VPPEIIVDDIPGLVDSLVARFAAAAAKAFTARGVFSIALPGGSVASTFFPRLAESRVDWSRVEFFWVDERAVPPDHPDSNYGVARTLWLAPAAVPPERVHRLPADVADLGEAAARHATDLVRVLGDTPILDLVLLGIGPDGHVASLFPGHPALDEEEAMVAAVEDAPKPPARRLTLTLPMLTAARLVLIAATGNAKAEVVRRALQDADSSLPVARVTRRAHQVAFLLDDAAASRLSRA